MSYTIPATILGYIAAERERQEQLWGGEHEWGSGSCANPDLPGCVKAAVLAEESGEACRAVLERDTLSLRDELIQVAAVAVAWLESMGV